MFERKSSYEYDELLACAKGELFGPGNAQLPYPPMLMFDRITEISETGGAFDKGFIRAAFSSAGSASRARAWPCRPAR